MRFAVPLASLVVVSVTAACAAGTDQLGGGLSATGATSTTGTSSGSGSGGASSTGSGTGGAGAAPAGTAGVGAEAATSGTGAFGTGGAGGAGGEAGSPGAGGTASTSTLLLAGTGPSSALGASYDLAAHAWTPSVLADASAAPPAIAITTSHIGFALIRSTSNGGELRYSTWSSSGWSPFNPVAAFVTTRARPSVAAASAVHVVFQGDDYKHYYARYQGAWAPTAEPVGGVAQQSFGPSPASVALVGSDVVIAFAGDNGDLWDQTRSGGAWQPATAHGLGSVVSLSPAIVALTQGPELMIVFSRKSDAHLMYTTRSSGTWSAPAEIANALSADPPSIAALASGAALVGFRGLDGGVYTTRFTPAAAMPWSTPAGVATPNFTTPSAPAVAAGIGGDDAELAFADAMSSGAVHARLVGNAWTTPMSVGGYGLTGVAMVGAP